MTKNQFRKRIEESVRNLCLASRDAQTLFPETEEAVKDLAKAIADASFEAFSQKKKAGGKTDGVAVWEAYREAWMRRYPRAGEPTRNAMINQLCATIAQRVGKEDGQRVVRYYVSKGDAFLVRNMHHLRYCVPNCETLLSESHVGRGLSHQQARQSELRENNARASREYLQRKHGKAHHGAPKGTGTDDMEGP